MSTLYSLLSSDSLISKSLSQILASKTCTKPRILKIKASLQDHPLGSKIFVRNLAYSIAESRLLKEFSRFGQITEVKLVRDEETKRPKGYAFIQYSSQDDAMLALENMDHKCIDDRIISVEIAKPMNNSFGTYPITSGPPAKRKNPSYLRPSRGDEIPSVSSKLK